MDREEARILLRQCQRDRREAAEAAKAAADTVESTRLIIEGILRRFPELSEDEQEWGDLSWEVEGQPRGDKAVLSILQVNENDWFSVFDMTEAMAQRGWLPTSENPQNAIRTALERLVTSDMRVEKGKRSDNRVVYRYSEEAGNEAMRSEAQTAGYGFDEEPF